MTTTTLIWLAIAFCATGTLFTILLFRGARPRAATPFPPILRSQPRPTDWTRHEGHIAR